MYIVNRKHILGALAAIACVGAQDLLAQRVPVQSLTKADAVFPEPFTSISGLRELSDGRILISDRTEKRISFIDFGSGSTREIGRVGEGPGEYQNPGGLDS